MAKNKTPSTKEFVGIADIRETVLILKNGSLRSVLEVNSLNFELKSADEQTAIIQAFQNFINSIDFPLQIVVNSRKLDITPYLNSLSGLATSQTNELLKIQVIEYNRFIKGLTELANIMAKKFYVVVPFYAIETPKSKEGFLKSIKGLFKPESFIASLTDEQFDNYKIQLNQRVDLIREGIGGLGLEAKPIGKEDLLNLYYSYYNPGQRL